MFYNRESKVVNLSDTYKGSSVFLFGGGRSITPKHIELSRRPGIVSASMNEGGHYIRPDIYMSTSGITMPQSVLKDPTIMKFVDLRHWDKEIYEDRDRGKLILEYPNVFGMYTKSATFEKFMSKDFIYKEKHKSEKYTNNSAMTMINLLVKLGFKRIYLVGMDFYGETNACTYFYEREYINTIDSNLIEKVKNTLKQLIELKGIQVYNTNPRSGLDFFRYIKLEDAIKRHEVYYKHDIHEDFTTERVVWGWDRYLGVDKKHLLK